MRALLVVLFGLALGAATAAARPLGFDHEFHDGKVTVTGAPSIPCADCHALDRKGKVKGRPGHASCFGRCHGAAPKRTRRGAKARLVFPAAQEKVCAACHDARTPKVSYPPYTVDPDFGLALSHARHAAVTACTTCHDAQARPAGGRSHARCAACHLAPAEAAVPGFADCKACHAAAWGPARGPELVPGPFAVGAAFRHGAHAKKAPRAACTSCHSAIVAAQGADLATPAMSDCATGGCHDRASRVSTTEKCTRCHTEPPPGSYELVRPDTPFSHDRHRARLPAMSCKTCHALDRRGEPRTPSHAACADSGCHTTDFASTRPVTCGACHVAIEPWRPLRPDALPAPETEFGATMPHRRHAGRALACASCHSLADARRQKRPPRGHASCRGDGCHGTAATPSPSLDACESCHRAGLIAAREQARRGARWTVRARFAHDAHAAQSCDTCHAGVWEVDAMPRPPAKKACAGCHDGEPAFKMTGHGCARCHGGE